MKFERVFTVLLLSLALILAGSGCVSQGEGAEDNSGTDAATSGTDVVADSEVSNIQANPITPWNPEPTSPVIDPTAYIHSQASVIGNVTIGANVMVSPMASVRSDEGMPIFVGDDSNIQDGVVLHALETIDEEGEPVEKNLVEVDGKKYAVYVGERVSLAHQSQVHGPAYVGNDTFIGMQAFVFKSRVGNNCVLEPTSAVIGVDIPDGRYVPAGTVVTTQAEADNLPVITDDYTYKHTNEAVVYVNVNLAEGYNAQ
jgi:carbonic anhydrase/acetyltransferase-like protein (isoleucine patch superfamily)